MLMLKRFVLTLLLLLVTNIPGLAQDWPPKIVRIVVPFGPGSTPDIVARLVQTLLQQSAEKSSPAWP